jgi:hypothetical protein
MSFRNGDKSREHRLRKAKQKKREGARELANAGETNKSPADASSKKQA